MFYTKWKMGNTHTPTLPHTNSNLAFCIWCSCQICVNKLFRVHCKCTTRYHQKRTCWRHGRYGGGGLSTKKSRKLLSASKASLKNWKFYVQKNRSNFRKGSSFVRFVLSEAKKLQNFWRNTHIHKFRTRSTFEKFASSSEKKSLVWAWLKPFKCIGLGSRTGGLGVEPPQYFEWGAGVSFSPPKKINILITLD